MAHDPLKKLIFTLPESLVLALDDYQKRHGIISRAETVRQLLARSLADEPPPDEPAKKLRPPAQKQKAARR